MSLSRLRGDRLKPSERQLIARAVRELTATGLKPPEVAAKLRMDTRLVRRIIAKAAR